MSFPFSAADDADGSDGADHPRAVAVLEDDCEQASHEVATLRFAAARIAALLGLDYGDVPSDAPRYWLPASTLSREAAAAIGIERESQLWGGVVPFPFVATKLVSHPLWKGRGAPPGWKAVPGIERCTLPGYSVFSREDAEAAGLDLLREGDIRLKSPYARGGRDQAVIRSEEELRRWLQSQDAGSIGEGLVIERHLVRAATYSVGGTRLRGREIAYHGEQRTVVDPSGATVYGGSTLTVFPGDFDALCAALPEGETAGAVRAAMRFDRAVRERYGVLASRCNYDVIAGEDSTGRRHAGVLEQSWRFGGASMAEVLALECFEAQPGLTRVVAETVESYSDDAPPGDAVVYWPGDETSPCKYARIVRHGR